MVNKTKYLLKISHCLRRRSEPGALTGSEQGSRPRASRRVPAASATSEAGHSGSTSARESFFPVLIMAPHSSALAWKIPWMEEPGGLQSMGSLRVGNDRATSLSLFAFMHWRGKWQPTPVFLPGESQGQGSLVGCRLWGHTESDTTEATQQQQHQ